MTDLSTDPQEQVTEITDTPDQTEDEALDAIFDKYSADEDEQPEIEEDEQGDPVDGEEGGEPERDEKGRFKSKNDDEVEEKPEEGEKAASKTEAPKHVAKPIADAWETLPEEARDAFSDTYKRMNDAMSEAGRLRKGLGPIHDTMVKAVQEFPELANMRPEQVAKDAMELARTRVQLQRDPAGTLAMLAQQTGVQDKLRQALGGQPGEGGEQAPNAMAQELQATKQELAQIKQQMQQFANPDTIRGTLEPMLEERQTIQQVQQWASGKEHYAQVEAYLPQFVQMAQEQNPGASTTDLLDSAYEMATRSFGLTASQSQPAPAQSDAGPRRAEAAIRANSVNRKSTGTKPAPMTDEESMDQVWNRMMKS